MCQTNLIKGVLGVQHFVLTLYTAIGRALVIKTIFSRNDIERRWLNTSMLRWMMKKIADVACI